jgi:hypothetical protein
LKYYLQIRSEEKYGGIWKWDGTCGQRVGVADPMKHANCHAIAKNGESFLELMSSVRPDVKGWDSESCFHELKLALGEYYPRMARPGDQSYAAGMGTNPNMGNCLEEVALMQGQLESLVGRLKSICQTVIPREDNFSAYGHEIRNLLILACTEVESQWRSILVANGVIQKNYSTLDYVKLSGPMRLPEYGVLLTRYPWLPKQRSGSGKLNSCDKWIFCS